MIYHTGETPGKGTYKCTVCGELVHLDTDSAPLPKCPKCGATTFEKCD